jgi:isohexenylglutaconyl-CoA hydratase
MSALVQTATADHVCTITLARPEKRNALTTAMIEELHAVRAAASAADVRVIVVAGAGQAFCAGLDLRELAAQREHGRVETHTLQEALGSSSSRPTRRSPRSRATRSRAAASSPSIATCVAADTARFAMPLARIGIAVPVTLTWKLVETIGAAATKSCSSPASRSGRGRWRSAS